MAGSKEGSVATANTSYQGKKFNQASGRGQTVDAMAQKLDSIPQKVKDASPEAVRQIEKAAGNPDAVITIYRATPGDSINTNDWVFLDKQNAEKWTKTAFGKPKPGYQVLEVKVKAKDVDWTGKNLEFTYIGRKSV